MGVIYKLRPEIVEFILNEKKANPALGCRSLVSLVEAKFQTKISKSAINGVIKNAQLSSSIGRKPLAVKVSFLRHSARPGPDASIGTPTERNERRSVRDRRAGERRPSTALRPSPEFIEGRSPKGEVKNLIEESHREEILPPLLRKQRGQNDVSGIFCDGAGCFFLKAAQWELFQRPILGKMISKYLSSELISDADTLMDVLLFLPMFGIRRTEDISAYSHSGLWALHGLTTEGIKPDKILRFVNEIKGQKDFFLRLSNEIPQIFFEAVYMKIVLEDQTKLVLDGQYRSLRSLKEKPVYYSLPIEKSLERLTSKIIVNSRPVVIKNISSEITGTQDNGGFSPLVYQWIAAFENMPGKRIRTAALLDEHGEEISTFTVIPVKRRFFMMGGYSKISRSLSFPNALVGNPDEGMTRPPTEIRFQRDLANLKDWRTFGGDSLGITSMTVQDEALEFSEESFLVKKNSILTEDLRLRAIFVKRPDSKDQAWVILTNIPGNVQSSPEVISEYLKEWPDFPLSFPNALKTFGGDSFGINSNIEDSETDQDFYNATKISFNPEEIPDLWDNLGAILAGLNKYCQRHFFPKNYAQTDISVMKSRFYQLAGSLKKDSGGLEISLILPEGYAYRWDLEQAVRTLNEFHVQNYAGQTVFLKIVP